MRIDGDVHSLHGNVRTQGGLFNGKWCHPRYVHIVDLPLVTFCDEPSADFGTNELYGGLQVALMSSLAHVASHDEVADLNCADSIESRLINVLRVGPGRRPARQSILDR